MINKMMYDDFRKYETDMIEFVKSISATLVRANDHEFVFNKDNEEYKFIKDKNGRIYFRKGSIKYFKMMLREYHHDLLKNLFPASYENNTNGKIRYDAFIEYEHDFIKYLKSIDAKDITVRSDNFSFKVKHKSYQCFKDKNGDVYFRKGGYDYFKKMLDLQK